MHDDFCGLERMIAGFSSGNEVNGTVGFLFLVQWVAGQMIEFGLNISFLVCQNSHFFFLSVTYISRREGFIFRCASLQQEVDTKW